MGVRAPRGGELLVSDEEMEAAGNFSLCFFFLFFSFLEKALNEIAVLTKES